MRYHRFLVVRVLRDLLGIVLVISLAGVVLAGALVALAPQAVDVVSAQHGESADVGLDTLSQRSIMYDDNGQVLAVLKAEVNRSSVPLERIPDSVVNAVLAIEDEEFWTHPGVNLRSTARALLENVEEGGIVQGGSTITQQVVKNGILNSEQTLGRKTEEALFALRLEDQFSKEEILERYLNTVYLGGGAYGVQAAAELYWGSAVEDLDWDQGALLAALIRNPRDYDPTRYPETALERRQIVLNRLVVTGSLTQEEADEYGGAVLPTTRQRVLPEPNDYFIREVTAILQDHEALGGTFADRYNSIFKGGLNIYTTFQPDSQNQALAARDEILPENDQGFTMAIAGVEPGTGAVRALVGGPGFDEYKYNLATQGLRQPGSSFKTFVLVAALENGFVPNDSISGKGPCLFENPGGFPDPYEANNFGRSKGGVGTIRSMTLRSSNCAYVRLGQAVGLDAVVETARRMGLTSPLRSDVLSLPLGAMEVSPLEMASAYAVLANDGIRHEPYYIERIEDRFGNTLYEHQPAGRRAISTQSARLAADVLAANVQGGTGQAARLDGGHIAAGKTGTAQNFEDAWFVGFTPHLSTAVWMGAPEAKIPMRNVAGRSVTGGSFPAQAWGVFMNAYHADLEPIEFTPPEGTRGGRSIKRTDAELLPRCAGMGTGETEVDTDFDDEPDCLGDHQPDEPVECPEGQVGIDTNGDEDEAADECVPADDEGNPITTTTSTTGPDGGGNGPTSSTSSTSTTSTPTSTPTSTSTTAPAG
ncbi:MAG: hypothetical protein GY713_10285 [Actinomycetia bacterium]|nr:hypothetical protein [Actinomycetes bacterium]